MAKKCRRIIFCTFLNTHKKAGAHEVAKPPMWNLAWLGRLEIILQPDISV